MEFQFITDSTALSELDVLVMIFNLQLMMSIFYMCVVGFYFTYILLKKVVSMNK